MERFPVSSSSVSMIGYDADTQALEVQFNNGGVYQYQGVPQDVFDQLMNAPSKGTFINQQIKNSYVFVRIS
ncbi:MAG: KTSC domain-containing protein [Terriglobales bacterium]